MSFSLVRLFDENLRLLPSHHSDALRFLLHFKIYFWCAELWTSSQIAVQLAFRWRTTWRIGFINDFDLFARNESRQRWIAHRDGFFVAAWKFLSSALLDSSPSPLPPRSCLDGLPKRWTDDNVCIAKASDNYNLGQGHEIISFSTAHSRGDSSFTRLRALYIVAPQEY